MNTIDNTADVIDSRDVIARIEELRAALAADRPGERVSDEDTAELLALEELTEQCQDYAPDWAHGEALIRDSYFKTYAQELAEEIGAINRYAAWPHTCIDWDQAASELQMDYTGVAFGSVTYWVR